MTMHIYRIHCNSAFLVTGNDPDFPFGLVDYSIGTGSLNAL